MTGTKENVASSLAARAAVAFGLPSNARATQIREGENLTYRMCCATGDYVLRIYRPGVHDANAIRSEHAWMRALAEYGLMVPSVMSTIDGDTVAEVEVGPRDRRLCAVFRWIDGEMLRDSPIGAEPERALALVGREAGRLHRQSVDWQRPQGFSRQAWDRASFVGDKPRWGPVDDAADWDRATRKKLDRARQVVSDRLVEIGNSSQVYGLIHADLSMHNVIIGKDGIAVIDFDDSGPGWFAYDLAVTLQEFELDPRYDALQDIFLDSYLSAGGPESWALREMPIFLMARRFARLGWMGSRKGTEHERLVGSALIASTPQVLTRFVDWAAGQGL